MQPEKMPEQRAQRGKLAGRGTPGHALPEQRGGETLHHLPRDFGRPLQRGAVSVQKRLKLQNIQSIGFHRGFRRAFLELHPGQKGRRSGRKFGNDFRKTTHKAAS